MDIYVSTGQWIKSIRQAIIDGSDGDCFLLPSKAHLHAYEIAKASTNSQKKFKVKVQSWAAWRPHPSSPAKLTCR